MAIDPRVVFANGADSCYNQAQIQALFDAYCFPCAQDGGTGGGCFKVLPSGTSPSQFPLFGWGNVQPDPSECPFLAVVVDCKLYLAPNDPSCNFLDPNIWVLIGGFIAAPKAQFSYRTPTPLVMTPDGAWHQLPIGIQEFNTMPSRLTAVGDTFLLLPGSYVIQSTCSFNMVQNGTEIYSWTRLFDVTHGVGVKQSNKIRMSGLGGAPDPINKVQQTPINYFRARVSPTAITTYQIEHATGGSDPGDFKIVAENNELYIEQDNN